MNFDAQFDRNEAPMEDLLTYLINAATALCILGVVALVIK